tara:strand:- start:221 stop:616 length:396 start_codon:yes stop_codon:yes gene_type:complete
MAAITKVLLSGSTNGRGIKLTDTAASTNNDTGYTIHTAVSGTTDIDEIWLWAHNSSTSPVKVTIEFGNAVASGATTASTDPDDRIEVTVPGEQGLMQIIPGLCLQNACLVRAFAATGNVITIHGFCNRIDY